MPGGAGYPDGFSLSHNNNLEQTVHGRFGSATKPTGEKQNPKVKPLCLVDALGLAIRLSDSLNYVKFYSRVVYPMKEFKRNYGVS